MDSSSVHPSSFSLDFSILHAASHFFPFLYFFWHIFLRCLHILCIKGKHSLESKTKTLFFLDNFKDKKSERFSFAAPAPFFHIHTAKKSMWLSREKGKIFFLALGEKGTITIAKQQLVERNTNVWLWWRNQFCVESFVNVNIILKIVCLAWRIRATIADYKLARFVCASAYHVK